MMRWSAGWAPTTTWWWKRRQVQRRWDWWNSLQLSASCAVGTNLREKGQSDQRSTNTRQPDAAKGRISGPNLPSLDYLASARFRRGSTSPLPCLPSHLHHVGICERKLCQGCPRDTSIAECRFSPPGDASTDPHIIQACAQDADAPAQAKAEAMVEWLAFTRSGGILTDPFDVDDEPPRWVGCRPPAASANQRVLKHLSISATTHPTQIGLRDLENTKYGLHTSIPCWRAEVVLLPRAPERRTQ